MENNPLVSIIIPAYNSSFFIPETLKCVVDQTYDNLECLIIDDGSTDNLKTVIKPFLEKHSFIKYIYQDNKGLSSARNTGVANSKGTYIQFLDADDLILPEKIKEQVFILEKNKDIGVSYTNYRPFNSDSDELLDRYSHLIVEGNPLEDFLFKWERGLSIPIHSALFRRSIWKEESIFNEQLEAKEDWAMWVSISLNGTKFHFLDKDYALYRMHSENMCKDEIKMLSVFLKASYYISEMLPPEYKDRFIVETEEYVFHSMKTLLSLNKDSAYASLPDENLIHIINSPEWKIFSRYYKLRKSVMPDGSRRKAFFRGVLNLLRNPKGTINDLRIKSSMTFRSFRKPQKVQRSNHYDVIFFSIIDWDFRYQRPQHIAVRFARNGHRVFYISINLMRRTSYSKSLIADNIYKISLPFDKNTTIYNTNIDNSLQTINSAFDAIFNNFRIKESVAFVEFPVWNPVVSYLKARYGTKVIFDCLDEFSGFEGVHADMREIENELLMLADCCISTSLTLYKKHKDKCKNMSLIRNATEFEHFHKLPANNLLKDIGKPVIGYYGAIAEWFDTETIEYIASKRPEWSIVLIGNTQGSFINVMKSKYNNIHVLGEKPYSELPKYLYWFDVCMIPFKLNDLIISTNPLKFYEFISSGKPVVSSRLPELMPYEDIMYISDSRKAFLENIEKALNENDPELIQRRVELAKANDWDSRFAEISKCIMSTFPLVSVVIVTFNNLKYTKLCIESIYAKTAYPNFELIIVDNASTDETHNYLNSLKNQHGNIKVVLNKENHGFAAANNTGIQESKGEYIILLNNDTVVTRGWISGLVRHLRNPEIGMVGPVTNSIGNEAKINVNYSALSSMDKFAEQYTEKNNGKTFEIPVLAMYCLAMRRQTIDTIGLLDEQFSVGMFEDDDYAVRVRKAGLKIICAEDVFIHHFGGASFSKLKSAEYQDVFNENKIKFEKKWDKKWIPHTYRSGVK